MQQPTIHDVAARAGVSIATVSRVLGGNQRVNSARAQRVRAAAKELGYQPNPLARGLRASTTATIGMVVPAVANPYYAALIETLVRQLHDSDREVFLCDSLDDPNLEAARVQALLGRRVDGLIIVPCHRSDSVAAVRAAAERTPVVQLDRRVDGLATDYVGTDDIAGIQLVIDHIDEPHREDGLHFVSATTASSTGQDRLTAFRAATNGRIPRSREHLGEFSSDWGHKACRTILNAEKPPRTIVCGADVIALGVLQGLREAGLEVPRDVLVTGYDDIVFAAMANPPLSTVRQPVRDLAAACIRRLDSRLADPTEAPHTIVIRPELVVRESTTTSTA